MLVDRPRPISMTGRPTRSRPRAARSPNSFQPRPPGAPGQRRRRQPRRGRHSRCTRPWSRRPQPRWSSRTNSRPGPEYFLFGDPNSAACTDRRPLLPRHPVPGQRCCRQPQDTIGELDLAVPPDVSSRADGVHPVAIRQGWVVLQAASASFGHGPAWSDPAARFYVLKDNVALLPSDITHPRLLNRRHRPARHRVRVHLARCAGVPSTHRDDRQARRAGQWPWAAVLPALRRCPGHATRHRPVHRLDGQPGRRPGKQRGDHPGRIYAQQRNGSPPNCNSGQCTSSSSRSTTNRTPLSGYPRSARGPLTPSHRLPAQAPACQAPGGCCPSTRPTSPSCQLRRAGHLSALGIADSIISPGSRIRSWRSCAGSGPAPSGRSSTRSINAACLSARKG